MKKIEWTPDGINSLHKILENSKNKTGLDRAKQIYEKIIKEIDLLEKEEIKTKQVKELEDMRVYDVYELVVQPWKIYCKIQECNQKVFILFVSDTRRNLEEILISKTIDNHI
jgi:plasmid stabilization system protein ParE